MELKTKRRQVVREVPWGMLVWQCTDTKEFAANEDGDIMHIFLANTKPELLDAAKKALSDAARGYGFPSGKCVFLSGRRPIDDEQLESQLSRAEQGLIPDPFDIAAIREEERALRRD